MEDKKRIEFLDELRGLAILLVIGFHSYARWPDSVPYGKRFIHISVFSNGWLGVQLFFLISGFVILMTLEKTSNFKQFIIKRWLRLFPAMLVATLLVYLTACYLPERPAGIPELKTVIPGLTFIDPQWIRAFTHVDTGYLEGAFWSLFVEVKFYLIFGLCYFYTNKYKAIISILACYLLYLVLCKLSLPDTGMIGQLKFMTKQLSFSHFGWFACGALAYIYYTGKGIKYLIYTIITGIVATLGFLPNVHIFIAANLIALGFIMTIYFKLPKIIVSNRLLLLVGFISYPLYLIHENALIALIVKLHKHFGNIPDILLPVLPVVFIMAIAYLIAKIIEPLLHKALKRIVSPGLPIRSE